jgi:HSP20 family protein
MSSKAIMTRRETRPNVYDPFSLARNFFGFDTFFDMGLRKSSTTYTPNFEVKETDDNFVLTADVPGIKKEDIDLSLHGNVLTVSGSRQAEERKESETYYLYERQYGSFARSFTMPDEANVDQVTAEMDNGVLTITMAKKAESKPRKIQLAK